jgi:hypothetical protein
MPSIRAITKEKMEEGELTYKLLHLADLPFEEREQLIMKVRLADRQRYIEDMGGGFHAHILAFINPAFQGLGNLDDFLLLAGAVGGVSPLPLGLPRHAPSLPSRSGRGRRPGPTPPKLSVPQPVPQLPARVEISFGTKTSARATEAAGILKKLVEEELIRIAVNPPVAIDALKPGEIPGLRNPSIARMRFGYAVERLVAARFQADRELRRLFEYDGGSGMPDYVGIGRFKGLTFELTTPRQVDSHRARPYGEPLIIVTYERP